VTGSGLPGRPRSGFLSIPREWFASVARGDITAEQLAILILVASEANWAETTTVAAKDGTRYRVGMGETLLGRRKFAARYGLGKGGRERVTRALRRGDVLGILSINMAEATPRSTPVPTPPGAPLSAPPPTLVKFKKDAEILFRGLEPAPQPAPPRAPPPAPGDAPIQEGNKGTTDNITSPPPAAPSTPGKRRAGKDPDPRHRPLVVRLVTVFAEVRGVPYGFQGGRDAKAVAELLRMSDDAAEIETRWRRALTLGDRFPGCASLSALVSRWNDLAHGDAGRASVVATRNAPQAPSKQFTTTFEEIE
jgi:hypothetical protein